MSSPLAQNLQSSPDHVAETILDGIKRGQYVPGQRLIEADLTAALAVSRGPVREALKRLAAEGVVRLIPHRGAYIRKLTRREVTDILVIQETLTALAARLAAENINTEAHRAAFEVAIKRLMTCRDRASATELLDERAKFYETLVAIGANRELSRFVPIPQTNLLRTQMSERLSAKDHERQFKEYEGIARYVLAGNGAAAESAMQRHIRNTRLSIERLDDAAFAPARTEGDDDRVT